MPLAPSSFLSTSSNALSYQRCPCSVRSVLARLVFTGPWSCGTFLGRPNIASKPSLVGMEASLAAEQDIAVALSGDD